MIIFDSEEVWFFPRYLRVKISLSPYPNIYYVYIYSSLTNMVLLNIDSLYSALAFFLLLLSLFFYLLCTPLIGLFFLCKTQTWRIRLGNEKLYVEAEIFYIRSEKLSIELVKISKYGKY